MWIELSDWVDLPICVAVVFCGLPGWRVVVMGDGIDVMGDGIDVMVERSGTHEVGLLF